MHHWLIWLMLSLSGRIMEKVKFTTITRTIDPKTRMHYLDAIDTNGIHWTAEMSPHEESWMCYTDMWKKDPQQPHD
jgi:hypothetical protein